MQVVSSVWLIFGMLATILLFATVILLAPIQSGATSLALYVAVAALMLLGSIAAILCRIADHLEAKKKQP